ncbi:MAG TPA: hypothetical protein VGP70_23200 [Actinomadura sp.]|jgi:hypothetical protein|nr:hypothetical protein [Actinomadura sp.]
MGIPKRVAVAMSGLVFAGSAALAVGAAAPASGQVTVMAPGQLVSRGCGCGGGCGGRQHSRWNSHQRNNFRHHQRVIVINRNNNFSRSANEQFQRQRGQQFNQPRNFRNFEEEED